MQSGFSLLEMVIGTALILALASLLTIWFGKPLARVESTRCLSNLRNAGAAMQLYIADKQNQIVTRRGGSGGRVGGDIWGAELSGRGYLHEHPRDDGYRTYTWQDPHALQCPAGKLPEGITDANWSWYTYGLNMFTSGSRNVVISNTDLNIRSVSSIENPTTFVLLLDSASGPAGTQTFRVRRTSGEGLALWHGDKGNVLFLDGHAEMVDRRRAEQLEIPAIHYGQ